MNIASRIDKIMTVRGLKSQAELARISGVPESTIARILKGTHSPSVENLAAIANSLHVSIDSIVNGTDNKNMDASGYFLVHVNLEELRLLTQFREANAVGRVAMKTAGKIAPKELITTPTTDSDEL